MKCLGLLVVTVLSSTAAFAEDKPRWASWRGPDQTGLAREKSMVTKWSPSGENLLWKSPEGGRTTPLILNDRVYYVGPVGEGDCLQERVICLDAKNGKTLWEHRFNVFFSDIVAQRVGWTALAADPDTGNVYAHGTGGEFLCLSRDGKILWSHSLTEEYNRISGYGGRLHTPVVDEDLVIISFLNTNWGKQARPAHRYVAFDKNNGEVRWWSEIPGIGKDTTYACPVVAVIDGRRQFVCPAADGSVYGLESRTGKVVWKFELSKMGLNSSPVVEGSRVYVSHSEENIDTTLMGRVVCIDAGKVGSDMTAAEVWRLDGLDGGYASPALANGRIYHVDNSANLHCIDAKSGKHAWKFKLGRVGKGSAVVTTDGVIYVGEQNGIFWILKDAGDHCEVLDQETFEGPNDTIDELYGSAAVCGGRVYFMTRYQMYCLGREDAEVERDLPPDAPPEAEPDKNAATLQLIPADVTVAPGHTVEFTTRQFTARGQPLETGDEKVEWKVADVQGTMDDNGHFHAASDVKFAVGTLTATVGKLTAESRIRVRTPPPFKEDFETMPPGSSPPGWIGAPGKTKIVERDGSRVLLKTAEKGKPSPVWKMRAYAGPPVKAGYTVEADLLGSKSRRFLPDMGIINNRYELIIMGMQKNLELSRWRDEPEHGKRVKVSFVMQPDLWYRVKLSVTLDNGSANVRGWVWPRGEEQPAEPTIAFIDQCPNLEGSPGLFVYSNGTTDQSDGALVFIDTFEVNESK